MPQIILAGVIAPLTGLARWLADGLITVRWAERALEALLPENDLALLQLTRAGYAGQIIMVSAHALVFVAASLMVLWYQGRGRGKG